MRIRIILITVILLSGSNVYAQEELTLSEAIHTHAYQPCRGAEEGVDIVLFQYYYVLSVKNSIITIKSSNMRRTFITLIAAVACIMTASAQDNMDQHSRQHFDQHFGVHFGTSGRPSPDHGHHYSHKSGIHMNTGLFFHRNSGRRIFLDLVHLKNGSEIIGVITSLVPGESLMMTTFDGSTHVYDLDEVTMVSKRYGRWSNAYRRQMRNYGDFNNSRGYFGTVELGVGALFYSENIRPSITIINGYRVCPQFAVGLGVGMNYYAGSSEFGVPVFLHVRSDFFNRDKSPFLALNIGGQISLDGGDYDTHDGIIVEPSFGYGFNVGPHQRMNVSLGIALDMYNERYRYHDGSYRYDTEVDAGPCLKIGYSF